MSGEKFSAYAKGISFGKALEFLSEFPRVQFAPLQVPLKRRLESLAILWYFTLWLQSHTIILVMMTQVYLWPLLLLYFTHIYFDERCEQGGRRSLWFRKLPLWKYVASYFPVTLVKEAELDPTKKYLFSYHPHGIIGNGVSGALLSDCLGFSDLFPGVTLRPLTLRINFNFPIYRELAYAMGFCSVSKRSITHLFDQGQSCLILPGGAEESLMSTPNTANLYLAKRKGFVAVAIKNGASLVPVYGFGENECFDLMTPDPESFAFKAQKFLKRLTGFTLPLYHGRTVFTYNYGLLPKRQPINVVVGAPIHLEKDPNPSREKVDQIHQQYLEALRDLYERNKQKLTPGEIIPELKFV